MRGIVERVVEAAALFPADGTIDNEGSRRGEVAKFQKVCRNLEIPIEFLDLGLEVA